MGLLSNHRFERARSEFARGRGPCRSTERSADSEEVDVV
jgi:hypothetical protein